MERRLRPREQGDIGELSAMQWFAAQGAQVFIPLGHSPDIDLIAAIDGRTLRVEVKTTTSRGRGRWNVSIATHGGNRSWSGVVKRFDRGRCDFLFVHVGDGRRWLIPTGALDCTRQLKLGGPKYAEYEIEQGAPLRVTDPEDHCLESARLPGEYRSGQTGCAVNALAQSFAGSNPASPITKSDSDTRPVAAGDPVRPTNYERKPGQRGEAMINQKRRLTIPQRPFFEAGLQNGGRVRVRAEGPGRLVVEQIELPAWARPRPPDRAG